jgi:hypothetical protein
MIRHQYEGMDSYLMLLGIVLQPFKIHGVILPGKETDLAIVTPLNNMLRISR